MKVKYDSNNSGGSWWLSDQDWKNLEQSGWKVEWYKDSKEEWPRGDENGRWLGALASSASKDFPNIKAALVKFEKITNQEVSDEGCNCCGAPHSFSWEGGYCSGEDCLAYLFDNVPKSLREATERLNP